MDLGQVLLLQVYNTLEQHEIFKKTTRAKSRFLIVALSLGLNSDSPFVKSSFERL